MSKQQSFDKVSLLGVSIDVVTLNEAINYICAYAKDHHKPGAYVIKPYVEFLDRAAGDDALADLLNDAELSVADGVAILWAAHYLYAGPRTFARFWLTLGQIIAAPTNLKWPVPERAAGTNFTWPLLKTAAANQLRVFLIGKESAADIELTGASIKHVIPEINLVGTVSGRDLISPRGQVSQEWIEAVAERVRTADADLILVGMGFPLQEQVCAKLATLVGHGVFIGEGGTFDYESFGGNRSKAPASFQRLGLEWLWRLITEPSRIRRQLAIPRFVAKIWQSRR